MVPGQRQRPQLLRRGDDGAAFEPRFKRPQRVRDVLLRHEALERAPVAGFPQTLRHLLGQNPQPRPHGVRGERFGDAREGQKGHLRRRRDARLVSRRQGFGGKLGKRAEQRGHRRRGPSLGISTSRAARLVDAPERLLEPVVRQRRAGVLRSSPRAKRHRARVRPPPVPLREVLLHGSEKSVERVRGARLRRRGEARAAPRRRRQSAAHQKVTPGLPQMSKTFRVV
mmetsp:Transcript_11799/g.50570  ORF Transcript_11799/g.50570 Transcript_11799/m.50570 type:complete len:226 (+) Transcript_11799:217-894(+)